VRPHWNRLAMNGSDLLSPLEYILRRISAFSVVDHFPWGHFNPTKQDVDGLSLTRESFATPEKMCEGLKGKHGYYVSRFSVQEVIDLGLSVVPTPQYGPGHVSIPELSYSEVKKDEAVALEKMRKLAALAWQRRVYGPTSPNST
jgi:hypothetical protein